MQNPKSQVSENAIQKTVMEWVRLNKTISPYIFHIPNEGRRTISYGKLLKDLGMRAGVSDLFVALPRHQFSGAFIELKSEKGKLSEHQKNFLHDMNLEGYFTKVCWSIDEAIETLKWYCFE